MRLVLPQRNLNSNSIAKETYATAEFALFIAISHIYTGIFSS